MCCYASFGLVIGRSQDLGRAGLEECRTFYELCIVWNTGGGDVW